MNSKMIAIAAVAIVVIGGVGVVFGTGMLDPKDDGPITIVDGAGKTITLDKPIDGAVSVNTNIPKQMKILGLEDELKGISFYTSKAETDAANWETYRVLFPDSKHMSMTKTMTAEECLPVAKYVICPVKSMTLSPDQEIQFTELGITVIRLDCNGDTALEDMGKLVKLFGSTDEIKEKYNSYMGVANGIIDTVKSKVAAAASSENKTFLCLMNSQNAFYNHTSAMNKLLEDVYGKNALRSIADLDVTGVTNSAEESGLKERIIQLDASKPIEKIYIRGTSSTSSESSAEKLWKDCEIKKVGEDELTYMDLSAVNADEVYIINSEAMSGCLSYVGYIIFAELNGIDTGYSVAEVVEQYNDKYGFDEKTSGYAFKIDTSTNEATELVF